MNHDGSLGIACRMVDVAADCGVDAVKFQTHFAAAETLPDAPAPAYFSAEPRYEYFQRTAFSRAQWDALKAHCAACKTQFLSSPFSQEAVELLETIGVPLYKIPSGEVTNLPLIEAVAATRKPVLLSSGMSTWAELDRAVNAVLKRHARLVVLQCTSEYPCPAERVGLNMIGEMRDRYEVAVGLSDHTLTNYAAFAAVTMGAAVIEKHFTLSRNLYGSDAKHSVEPVELCDLVRGIRAVETMVSKPVDKDDPEPFRAMKRIFQKSIVSLVEIPQGARIERSMVGIKKPGTGLPAWRIEEILGRRALRRVPADSLLHPDDIDWDTALNA